MGEVCPKPGDGVLGGHILSVPFPLVKDGCCCRQECESPGLLCEGSAISEGFICKRAACAFWEFILVPCAWQSIPGVMLLCS